MDTRISNLKQPLSAKFELHVDTSNCGFTGYEIVSSSVVLLLMEAKIEI